MKLLDDVTAAPAYALIRFGDEDAVTVLTGTRTDLDRLADVPLEHGPPQSGRRFDRLLLMPFAQVRERGFAAHQDGTPLSSIGVDTQLDVPVERLLAELPDEPAAVAELGGFDVDDRAYAALVRRVIEQEIGNGEGANLVIARSYRARLANWGPAAALSAFHRLLVDERGAYWTFLVFTGDRYLIGASPERHVSVRGGEVAMNPISGTFRLSSALDQSNLKARLLDFLATDKEVYELFMVVDEELKVMCEVCGQGGRVLGPYLKPMSHLVHTEYLLAGRTGMDVREVLRRTMYAATVTGSPVRNACRLIQAYEPGGRGYYGAALALVGRDASGAATADAPILIRTADVGVDGNLRVSAGATLVRDSDPEQEVLETHAKAAGVLAAFGLAERAGHPSSGVAALVRDGEVRTALESRNRRLSTFWLTDQSDSVATPELAGRTAIVLDAEDDFVTMLSHLLRVLGMEVTVLSHQEYEPGSLDGFDLVLLGPGPGDPRDRTDPKIAALGAAVDELLAERRPFLAVCLGHQILCDRLGLPLAYKDIVFQGTQTSVHILGRTESVGFYNTFVARVADRTTLPAGVTVDVDADAGDVHLIRGPHFAGVQFHAESILTEHGYDLLRELVASLLGARAQPTGQVKAAKTLPD